MPTQVRLRRFVEGVMLGIPMMSISHSDLMPISSERSDAGLSQCEAVIDIRQDFSAFYCRESLGVASFCFLALTEGARRATGVSAHSGLIALPPGEPQRPAPAVECATGVDSF